MPRFERLGVAPILACLLFGGCGGEEENGSPKSPYAPTQAQLDELNKKAAEQYAKLAHQSVAKRRHR